MTLFSPTANMPDWEEVSGSPESVTNAAQIDVSLTDAYDMVLVMIEDAYAEGGSGDIRLSINGEQSGGYTYRDVAGSTVSSASLIPLGYSSGTDYQVAGSVLIDGSFVNRAVYAVNTGANAGSGTARAVTGKNGRITGEVNSIQVDCSGTNIAGKVRVFGL